MAATKMQQIPKSVLLIQKTEIPQTVVVQGISWSCWADLNRRPHPYQLFFGCFSLLYLVASLRLETVDIKGFSKTLSVNFRRLLRPNVATFLLYVATLVATFL